MTSNYEQIARKAEQDVNSYRAKQGHSESVDNAGVDSSVEKKFPGAEVRYGDDLSGSRHIPPQEGGELDARGRQAPAGMYEGYGGPSDKIAAKYAENPGLNDADVGQGPTGRKPQSSVLGQGEEAVRSNIGGQPTSAGGKFRGQDYYNPEDVPDSIAAENNIPPGSITQASRETEGYGR